MSSRITSSMLSTNYLRNMNRNMNNMQTLQNQLASGKEINIASDNPYKASRSMQLHSEMSYNTQYNENIKDTSNWLDTTDTALSQVGNIFGRIETLLVNAGNGTYGDDEKTAIQDEIKEKVNELSQVLNTSFDGSYIFGGTKTGSKPTTVVDGVLQYANSNGEAINTYLNIAGKVTNSPISNNKALTNEKIYLDSNGKVTTSLRATDGNSNTPIISSSSLYLDSSGNITRASTATDGTVNTSILLKDTLYTDMLGNVTTSKTEQNTLMTSSNALYYVDLDGNVTTQKRGDGATVDNKLISSDDSLYVDSNGKVTTKSAGNTLLNTGDSLYADAKGNITTSSISINNELEDNATLYNDDSGNVTINSKDKDGNLYTPIESDSKLYIDTDGNITTSSSATDGTTNKVIILNDSLYSDESGNVKASVDGTIPSGSIAITTDANLFVDKDGNLTTTQLASDGTTKNTKIILGDTLYLDGDDNITISPTAPNTLITSSDSLYSDGQGNVTNVADGNTLIKSGDPLYIDENGNITTINSTNTLVYTGDSLYVNKSGKVTTSPTTPNIQLTAKSTVYIDDAGNLTMSSKNINQKLTMSDIKNLESELNNSNTTETRKTEINAIFENKDVAQLVQIDSDLKVDISQGIKTTYNKNAADVLEFTDKNGKKINVSDLLSKIINDLGSTGTTSDLITTDLADIQSVTANLLQQRSEVGTMQNRMDSAQTNNETQNYNMTDILSKTEDIDFAEKTMEYSMMQTVYTAALQTSAKILPMTILTYL